MSLAPAEVLLVEFEPTEVDLARAALSELHGSQPLHAAAGAEAWSLLRRRWPQGGARHAPLILLDCANGKAEGWRFLTALKRDAVWRRVPVVVLVAAPGGDAARRAYALYANACVEKPAGAAQFKALVGNIGLFWLGAVTLPPDASVWPGGEHVHSTNSTVTGRG